MNEAELILLHEMQENCKSGEHYSDPKAKLKLALLEKLEALCTFKEFDYIPTSFQLLEQLGDNQDITIMSDIVNCLDLEFRQVLIRNNMLEQNARDTYETSHAIMYEYQEKINNVLNYIHDKLVKSFNYEIGTDGSNQSDRLLTETVVEFQVIENMLKDHVTHIKSDRDNFLIEAVDDSQVIKPMSGDDFNGEDE